MPVSEMHLMLPKKLYWVSVIMQIYAPTQRHMIYWPQNRFFFFLLHLPNIYKQQVTCVGSNNKSANVSFISDCQAR